MERIRRSRTEEGGDGNYFVAPKLHLRFIKSGCTRLDLVLGGGYALGRVINIVGDKAVGKTLLAIEAASNFLCDYPKGRVWYCEAEAAFDEAYAEALGMPIKKVKFRRFDTIEDVGDDLMKCIQWSKDHNSAPGLYVIDSLDALSDRKAKTRAFGEQGWHLEKPKLMSELFNRFIQDLEESNICLMIISQVRDKIGVTFGDKHSRSGGKALDLYASQIMYLSHLNQVTRTIKGQKRVVGVRIKAKNKKNKVGIALRDCEFIIQFGYGVDNVRANLEWLTELGRLEEVNLNKKTAPDLIATRVDERGSVWERVTDAAVRKAWIEIETSFLPKTRKYNNG